MVYNKFGSFPKAIRSDNGCEYKSKAMINYLQMKGITSQYTVPYCPQQNGIAERKNRSLVEMSRCMLAEANMSYTYWGEAANYIQNRLTSSAIPCTPYMHQICIYLVQRHMFYFQKKNSRKWMIDQN